MAPRRKYTPAEDSALLAFVEANKHRSPIGGNKLWQLAEAQRVTPHSWQSMKGHYELLAGETKWKAKKRAEKKADIQRRLGFNTSTSTSTLIMPTPSTSTQPTPSTSTATPQVQDDATQTDGTGMVGVGVGIHLFCPVTQYRPVDASTQTPRPPSH